MDHKLKNDAHNLTHNDRFLILRNIHSKLLGSGCCYVYILCVKFPGTKRLLLFTLFSHMNGLLHFPCIIPELFVSFKVLRII